MIDAQDPDSEWRVFWDTLPKRMTTGLLSIACSVGELVHVIQGLEFNEDQLEDLKGMPAYDDIQSSQHVRVSLYP